MAEYFESGSATDVNELLGKFRSALIQSGFASKVFTSEGTGLRAHLSKGGLYVNLRSGLNNELPVPEKSDQYESFAWRTTYQKDNKPVPWAMDWIGVNVGSGVDINRSWHSQPGAYFKGSENRGVFDYLEGHGALTRYWVFIHENPDSVLLIAEYSPNKFSFLQFGHISKSCDYLGGRFFWASFPGQTNIYGRMRNLGDSHVQCLSGDFANHQNGWGKSVGTRVEGWTGGPSRDGWDTELVPNYRAYHSWRVGETSKTAKHKGPLQLSHKPEIGRPVLYPCLFYVERNYGYSTLGVIEHTLYLSNQNFQAADTFNIADDLYMVFPFHTRKVPWDWRYQGEKYSLNSADRNPNMHTRAFYHFGVGVAVRVPTNG